MADKKIHEEPFNTEIRRFEGGFEWVFYAPYNDGRRDQVKEYHFKFDRWWLSYLARDLRSVLHEEMAELERLKSLCGWEDDE